MKNTKFTVNVTRVERDCEVAKCAIVTIVPSPGGHLIRLRYHVSLQTAGNTRLLIEHDYQGGLNTLKLGILPTQCICVFPVRYGLPTVCLCVSCEVRTAHTVYLCVPYGSHSKQRLFPHTALTGGAL
jgi:hypothetical protein